MTIYIHIGLTYLIICILTMVVTGDNAETCDMMYQFHPRLCKQNPMNMTHCTYGPPKNISHCKNILVSTIENKPFSDNLLPGFLTSLVLQPCCGCINITNYQNYKNISEFLQQIKTNPPVNETILYPVLGEVNEEKYYGLYFVPMFHLTQGSLITLKKTQGEMIKELIHSVFNLWPLLIIFMLLSWVSGVTIWILEMKSNEESFKRNFPSGCFDRFWWGFISMTTVGYGDKVPVTAVGRFVSIFWIIIGLTLCSILTAAMTGVINQVSLPNSSSLKRQIGVLNDRLYEMQMVVHSGGQFYEGKDLKELIQKLEAKEIDGILLDYVTKTILLSQVLESMGRQESFFHSTILQSKAHSFAYGALFKNKNDAEYFKIMIRKVLVGVNICLAAIYQDEILEEDSPNIFSSKSTIFQIATLLCGCILVCVFIFGLSYEYMQKRRMVKKSDQKLYRIQNDDGDDDDVNNIV